MPIIKPTVFAYRNLIGADGRRLEIRISKNEHYKFGVDNPSEVIYLDDMTFPPDAWGAVGFEEFDEDGDAVPISFNFGIADQFTFSGVLGDATVISLQDLRTENTTLVYHIIDDVSRNVNTGRFNSKYYVWLSWLNEDNTLDEIFYSGSIDLSKMPSNPFYTEQFMTNSQSTLETVKLQSSTISDILSQLSVQDLVESITQSDMATSTRQSWYAGYNFTEDSRVHYPGGTDTPPVVNNFNGNGDNFKGELNFALIAPDDHLTGYLPAYYPYDINTDFNPFNGNVVFNDRVNAYGVKHGFQGISYNTLLNKVASLGEFVLGFTGVPPFTVYKPFYSHSDSSDHYAPLGLDSFIESQLSSLYRNYNVLFGVRPDDPLMSLEGGADLKDGIPDYTKNGRFSYRTIIATSGTSPVVFELDSAPDFPLFVGQNVYNMYISGSSTGDIADSINANIYVHSIIDDTHITLEFGEGNTGHANGDVINTGTFSGAFAMEWASQEWYDGLQTPVTIPRTDTLLTFLIAILNRNGLAMEWDIEQSGTDIGKPILIPIDPLGGTHTAPAKWASPEITPKFIKGAETQTLNLAKTAVKLTNMGDSTAVYCPRKPKVNESAIEKQIISRVKKWGEFTGYRESNFINNRDNPVQSQGDTFYTIDNKKLTLGALGYLIGANDFFYFPDSATQIYNTNYNTHFPKPDHTDASGFYAACYEEYHGNYGLLALADVNKDKYNTLVSKAQVYANLMLYDKVAVVRPMRGMTDDNGSTRKLFRKLITHWRDPDGTVRNKRSTKVYLNVRTGDNTIHWVNAVDTFIEFPYVIEDGSASTGGGIAGGGISGGGGGGATNLSGAVIKAPDSASRNDITPTDDAFRALALIQHSDTQSAHLLDVTNDDGTIILSGITEIGSFFSNIQGAFIVNPWGTSAGDTGEIRFLELAANGTNYAGFKAADSMATNNIYVLPNAYPTSTAKFLQSSTAGALSWVAAYTDLGVSLTSANGILLSGTGGTPPGIQIGISTNGVALDRLAQIADQTILGNNSGSTGSVIALTAAQASVLILPSQGSNSGKFLTTNGTVASWATVSSGMAIGNTVTSGTSGSILYVDSSGFLAQDNGNLFYDATNHAVSIGGANSIGSGTATGVDRLILQNTSAAATGGGNQQWSPNFKLRGSAWDSGSSSSKTHDWIMRVEPAEGNPSSSIFKILKSINGGSQTLEFAIKNDGSIFQNGQANGVITSVSGTLTANTLSGNSILFATGSNTITGNSTALTFSSGILQVGVSGGTSGEISVIATAGSEVMKISSSTGANSVQVFQDRIQTTNNTATVLHSYSTTTGHTITIYAFINYSQTNNGGTEQGHSGSELFSASFRNVGGTVTQVGGDSHIVPTNDISVGTAPVIASNINGTAVEIKFTGVTGRNIDVNITGFYFFV